MAISRSRTPQAALTACVLFAGTIVSQVAGSEAGGSSDAVRADVVAVRAVGEPGAYRFEVEVRSPDLGCEQYADWWEVVREDGSLIHRRVLSHSHVDEQPFTRSGEPVVVEPDTVLWVRAHMHPGGYGGRAFRGSVTEGFESAELSGSFAAELEDQAPQPPECRW